MRACFVKTNNESGLNASARARGDKILPARAGGEERTRRTEIAIGVIATPPLTLFLKMKSVGRSIIDRSIDQSENEKHNNTNKRTC